MAHGASLKQSKLRRQNQRGTRRKMRDFASVLHNEAHVLKRYIQTQQASWKSVPVHDIQLA
jgi:hypothetical protein